MVVSLYSGTEEGLLVLESCSRIPGVESLDR